MRGFAGNDFVRYMYLALNQFKATLYLVGTSKILFTHAPPPRHGKAGPRGRLWFAESLWLGPPESPDLQKVVVILTAADAFSAGQLHHTSFGRDAPQHKAVW